MRITSFLTVGLLAAAVALPASVSIAQAKTAPPPGSCAVGKAYVATNTFCSFDCDPATNWCSQQLCTNGTLTKVIPCYGTFCSVKCGG